jgi:hypothetical protein
LYQTFKEIDDFTSEPGKEQQEIKLVSSYLESQRIGKYSKEIAKMLTPYYRDKERIGRAHPIFIGYEWDSLNDVKRPKNQTLGTYLHELYKQTHSEKTEKINDKISKLAVAANREFYIWILPFAVLQDIRNKFLAKLGVTELPGDDCYE